MRKLFSVFLSLTLLINMMLPVSLAMATVSSETNSISYNCNGVTTAYTYTFKIFEDDDILVIKKLTSTGAETTLALTTDYTVTGEGDAGGGTVTLTAGSVCGTGYTLTLTRNVDYKQETDYVEGDAFPADAHEDALDKLAMQVQQIKARTDRAIKFPKTITTDQELPALETRKNRVIGFDSSGNLSMLVPTTDGVSTVLTQTNTFTAQQEFSAGLKTDTISEYTAGSGVTIDSVLLKDGNATIANATLSGILNEASGATIASSTTTDIGAAVGNYLEITGTTSISGLGTVQAGARRIVHFTGALALLHNATSLILPTSANITTAAGDVATFVSLGSGNWRATGYMKADGTALVGATGFASTYAHAYRSAAYSPPRAVETKIALDAESYDPGGNMDVVTNNRYNVPSTGVYFIDGGVDFIEPFGDGLQTTVQIRLNGTTIIRNEQSYGYTNSYPVVRVSGLYYLTAGQYVELYVLHMAAEATRALDVNNPAKNYLRIIRAW